MMTLQELEVFSSVGPKCTEMRRFQRWTFKIVWDQCIRTPFLLFHHRSR